MLDTFLKVAYHESREQQERDRQVELMRQMPEDYLLQLASGTEKLAYGDKPETWLEQFKGTPLFEEAMELEKKDLELQLLQKQQRQEDDLMWREDDARRDELCIQRKMLELQLAGLPDPGMEAAAPGMPPEAPEVADAAPEGEVGPPEAATPPPAPPVPGADKEAEWNALDAVTRMKVAYFSSCSDWVEKFKGTPLFEQAVAIEEEELEMEMARLAKRNEKRLGNDQIWNQKDQLRAQRKMLSLELMKLQHSGQVPDKPAARSEGPFDGAIIEKEGMARLSFKRALVKQAEKEEGSGVLHPAQKAGLLGAAIGAAPSAATAALAPSSVIADMNAARQVMSEVQGLEQLKSMPPVTRASILKGGLIPAAEGVALMGASGLAGSTAEGAGQGALRGGLAGAGTGGLIGAARGRALLGAGGALPGAAIGAGFGGLVGAGTGAATAKPKKKEAFAPALMAAGKGLMGSLGTAAKAAPAAAQRLGTAVQHGGMAGGARAAQRMASPHVQKAVQYAKANPLQAAGIAGAAGLGTGMMLG